MIHRQRGKTVLVIAAAVAVGGLSYWLFPPFRIVPLKGVREQQEAAAFDAPKRASEFWEKKLLPATSRAVEARELLSALGRDAGTARQGRDGGIGFGGTTPFLVKGTGRVTAVEEGAVVVAIEGTDAKVRLFTGLLFGNAVRDATGLLDVSTYANSQDFNDLSTQLNTIVEAKVAPALRKEAAVGRTIRFVGCAEPEEGANADALPLVIPVKVEWP